MEVYRGEIYFVSNTNGSHGCEIKSNRPAIVVSNDIGNKYAPIVEVVYLTTQPKKGLPTHVPIVCQQKSTALCEQIFTVSKDRLIEFVRVATDEEMKEIDKALAISLGIVSDDYSADNESYNHQIAELLNAIEERNKIIEELSQRPTDNKDSIERDLYKNLYESLLNKVMSA